MSESMRLQSKRGAYVGDGVNAVSEDLGFRPKKVVIYNKTDGDVRAEIIDDGADGYANILVGAAGPATLAGAVISDRGFNTGNNASMIENTKEYGWYAEG